MMMFEFVPFTKNDMDTILGWIHSEKDLTQWAGSSMRWPLDRAQLENHFSQANKPGSAMLLFKVIDSDSKRMMGYSELAYLDHRNRCATIGRVLVKPTQRNQGIGKFMITQLLQMAFKVHQMHRVDLLVFDFNDSAIRCYESAGFQKEGKLRDIRRYRNEYWTYYMMSILEDEWKVLQK